MVGGSSRGSHFFVLLVCMLSGLTIGYFIGNLCNTVDMLKWMNYTGVFGLDQPFQVNLGVIWFSFQIKFKITLTSIIGLLLGILLYKKVIV